LKQSFLDKTKLEGAKNIRGHCPRMPLVATGLMP